MDQFNDMKVLTLGWKVFGNANFLQFPDLCIKVEGSLLYQNPISICVRVKKDTQLVLLKQKHSRLAWNVPGGISHLKPKARNISFLTWTLESLWLMYKEHRLFVHTYTLYSNYFLFCHDKLIYTIEAAGMTQLLPNSKFTLKEGDLIQFRIFKKEVLDCECDAMQRQLSKCFKSRQILLDYIWPQVISIVYFFKLLVSLPGIFTSHFIFMMNRYSKPRYTTMLNSLDPLPYLKNETIMNVMLLFRGVCV